MRSLFVIAMLEKSGGHIRFIAALLVTVFSGMAHAAPPVAVFPEKHWEKLGSPAQHGWSVAKLDEAHQFARTAGSAALLVVHQGKIVDDWGATTQRFNVHPYVKTPNLDKFASEGTCGSGSSMSRRRCAD